MIITQTPLRISLAGGGTDFAGFYEEHGGEVLSTAIDKFIYVVIKGRFDEKIRVGYTRTEMVDNVDDIEHELVRECLKLTGLTKGLEISTMADIPSEGSGLGSSSTVTVGLLHAMYTYKGELVTAERLAQEACQIEIGILGKPIGKQDQYIAAYGGIRRISFLQDGTTTVQGVNIGDEQRQRLSEVILLFYTGITRKADSILAEQKDNIGNQTEALIKMRSQVPLMQEALESGSFQKAARILQSGWELKKALAGKITTSAIDILYDRALDAGATGGKIAGAGGGGFLLLFCPPDRQSSVRQALADLKELPFNLEVDGSKVIFNNRRT
jgi:D-glycero-alpha-D-manno-heptose-7-phosphate kinase